MLGSNSQRSTPSHRIVLACLRSMKTSITIGEYLIQRLYAHGVRHVFGIPGDYDLAFYDMLERSQLRIVNTFDEQGAGFAADAYARVRGLNMLPTSAAIGSLSRLLGVAVSDS